jgi:hypothetical protein
LPSFDTTSQASDSLMSHHSPSHRQRSDASNEAWILGMHRSRDRVKLRLLTSDGRLAERVVAPEDADWLELAPGQIVTLSDQVSE